MAQSIFSRKRDLLYLIFFLIHLPVIFLVDATALYPEWAKLDFIVQLREYYVATYQDQFFVAPPAWFGLYTWMELLYHAPLSVWAIGALIRDDPKVPLHLLVFACQTGLTTVTCISDLLSWENFSSEQKMSLSALYVTYLALGKQGCFMGVDMMGRLNKTLNTILAAPNPPAKKTL